jgi:hypothetical protein
VLDVGEGRAQQVHDLVRRRLEPAADLLDLVLRVSMNWLSFGWVESRLNFMPASRMTVRLPRGPL